MESTAKRLWNRDFLLLIVGQVISIFGNMILSFALALYVLDFSESPAIYGLVSGIPYFSLIAMSPIGGILADRLKKQRIMFWLDAATTAIIIGYMAISGIAEAIVPIILLKLLALKAIQGIYLPTVQSSVHLLIPYDNLAVGNAAVGIVNSLSTMVGLSVAGILYGRFGLFPILTISAICFAITAVMDLLIRIPHKKQIVKGSVSQIIFSDVSRSVRFAINEKPTLAICAVIAFLLVTLLNAMLIGGIPVLLVQHLGLGMEMVGVNQSIIMLGAIAGGVAAGAFGIHLSIPKSLIFLMFGGICLIPVGVVLQFNVSAFASYAIITTSGVLIVFALQLFNIVAVTFVQKETPTELVGKVLSILMMLPYLANATGQLLYGVLFDYFAALPWIVVFCAAALSVAISIYSRRFFKR